MVSLQAVSLRKPAQCSVGVNKTYKLTYESADIMHALFDESTAKNSWAIGSHVLKTFCEYFGAKKESLDLFYDGNRAIFTSYSDRKIKEEGRQFQSDDKLV